MLPLTSWQLHARELPDELTLQPRSTAFSLPGAKALADFADLLGEPEAAPEEDEAQEESAPFALPAMLPDSLEGPVSLRREIDFGSLRRSLKYTIPTTIVRLVVIPGVLTLVGMLLGFRGIELGTIFLFNASCTVVAGYVMAAAMGGDTAIAAESLGLTALFSSVTVTLGLTVLLNLGLI